MLRRSANVPPSSTVGDPVCTHGDLRLQDGDTLLEGRVEICIGGTWGSICDDLWDDRDAAVACNQLGFSRIGKVSIIHKASMALLF